MNLICFKSLSEDQSHLETKNILEILVNELGEDYGYEDNDCETPAPEGLEIEKKYGVSCSDFFALMDQFEEFAERFISKIDVSTELLRAVVRNINQRNYSLAGQYNAKLILLMIKK